MSQDTKSVEERPAVTANELPGVPLTLEGSSVLHQMFRVRWPEWKKLERGAQREIVCQAAKAFEGMKRSAAYSLLGHKGDLLLVHFRESFDELNRVELHLAQLDLWDYLEPASSYLSIVELGLYDSTIKLYASLAARGVEPHSEEWNRAVAETAAMQRKAMQPRLEPEIPPARYLCFYPMDRKRGEDKNFYTVPMSERGRMMREHGMVGRRYAGEVQQIITGSIGFDDWEWGVDLFAEDPLIFKKLIYEMRFDEVSAVYALFGTFYIGVRVEPKQLNALLIGGELAGRG